MTPVFELKNVNYYYDHKKVLENINIKINKGEFLAIVGPNGAGKSTLLKLILGLLPLQSGEIFVEGIDFKNKKTSIKLSYVSQKANAFNSGFPASVKEVVLSGLTKTKRLFQTFNSKDNEKVIKVLERLNISDLTTIIVIAIIVVLFITLFYKELFILSFDEEYSKVIGIPKWIQFLFIVIVAMVISASMRVVGILLVSALITLPIAISMRITKSFKQLILLSVFLGELSVILGLVLAFYMDISPGGVIVVLLVILLMITMAYQKMRMKFKKGANINEYK